MTNSPDERVSALLDGELAEHELQSAMDELLAKDDNRKAWARYHLIGDTLKRNLPTGIDHDFSSRVMAVLDDEPTVLAPPPSRASWGQRAAGLAVAASVAAVAVLGVQFVYQEDAQAPVQQVAQQASPAQNTTLMAKKNAERVGIRSNIQTVTQPAGQSTVQLVTQSENSTSNAPKIVKHFHPRLNKYLVDHNQQASQAVQGVVPYARIVAYPNSHRILIQAQK